MVCGAGIRLAGGEDSADVVLGSGVAVLRAGRLPQYRGARPVNWALLNGESIHGVTIHAIDAGIDSGPVFAQALFSIWPEIDEVRDVWERSMRHARLLISDTLPRLDRIAPRLQAEERAVTHYMRENHLLGERADWTRATSVNGP
ncbi:formyltransferase family protein [Streptomyces lavendulocolor]|uniref:formyltransferase family protein n=1 Tax=Streptomyces lavendulocolor TaxID=67316 RepID=UPI003C2FF878